jgi:hypothetical protein
MLLPVVVGAKQFGMKLWASLKDRCPNASPLQGYIHFQKSPKRLGF